MFFSIVQQADTFKCWYTLRYPMQELLCMTVVWTKHKKLSTLCLITWENCRVLSSGYSTFSYFEELKLGKRSSISKKCLPSLYTCNQREYSISECVLGTVSHVDFLSLWKLRGALQQSAFTVCENLLTAEGKSQQKSSSLWEQLGKKISKQIFSISIVYIKLNW